MHVPILMSIYFNFLGFIMGPSFRQCVEPESSDFAFLHWGGFPPRSGRRGDAEAKKSLDAGSSPAWQIDDYLSKFPNGLFWKPILTVFRCSLLIRRWHCGYSHLIIIPLSIMINLKIKKGTDMETLKLPVDSKKRISLTKLPPLTEEQTIILLNRSPSRNSLREPVHCFGGKK